MKYCLHDVTPCLKTSMELCLSPSWVLWRGKETNGYCNVVTRLLCLGRRKEIFMRQRWICFALGCKEREDILGGSLTNPILFCSNDIVSEKHSSMAKKAQGKSVPGTVLVRILSLLEHQRLARLGLQKSQVWNVLRDHLATNTHAEEITEIQRGKVPSWWSHCQLVQRGFILCAPMCLPLQQRRNLAHTLIIHKRS